MPSTRPALARRVDPSRDHEDGVDAIAATGGPKRPNIERKTTVRTPRPHQLVPPLLHRHVLADRMHVRQLRTAMALEHDGQRRPVRLRELDLVLLGGADLHDALALLDHKGRPGRRVLDLPVGPRKNFLRVLHDLDLRGRYMILRRFQDIDGWFLL